MDAPGVTYATGVVTAGTDSAAVYDNTVGVNTTVPYLPALNPSAGSPFSVEFWADPSSSAGGDTVVSDGVASGNQSGWAITQRSAGGWEFQMFNGTGSETSYLVTGGTSVPNAWVYVVFTWNGTIPHLYFNGTTPRSVIDGGTGTYDPNTTVPLTIGSSADGTSPYAGTVDEVAFYATALTTSQVAAHYAAVSSPTPGAYFSLIQSDGALLQLSNNGGSSVPEPTAVGLIGTAAGLFGLRRRRTV